MRGYNKPFARNTGKIVSVVGLGYIGLPTAAMFASKGVKVIGVDVNEHAVARINQGRVHIVEPDLEDMVRSAVAADRLRARLRPQAADAFLLAVPTPFTDDHKPDLTYIEAAARAVAHVLQKGNLVVLESTSPVGTTEQMAAWMAAERPDLTFPQQAGERSDIRIAYCPERVLPGRALHELVENDRIIGGMTPLCARRAAELYETFVTGECCITTARTAEMCKLTENAFRDVNIAFANELSIICDKLDIDVWELIRLANRHPRVNILQPGPGVGGHCIAVDPWFIVHATPEEARLIWNAREVNDSKPQWVSDRVEKAIRKVIENGKAKEDVRIVCLGIAFKPDIDDLRESPAMSITRNLARKYRNQVNVVEPNINEPPVELAELGVSLLPLSAALSHADVVVVLVDHKEFKAMVPVFSSGQQLVDSKGVWTQARQTEFLCEPETNKSTTKCVMPILVNIQQAEDD